MVRMTVRSAASHFLARIPAFKGKGRLTLLVDSILTDPNDQSSYETTGFLNGTNAFHFDLRPWGQKFAYYYQQWEKEYVEVLRELYRGGEFIDIGSSLGLYVICLAEKVRASNGHILSVEPVSFNLERQKKNVELNRVGDLVEYITCALGDRRGTVRIKADELGADNNAFVTAAGDLEIEVVTLDEIVAGRHVENIGAIKMDVEGYEPMVILGAKQTIQRYRPVILAEFCRERMEINGFDMQSSWDFLVDEQGYRCYVLEAAGRRLKAIQAPETYQNLFFIPNDTAIPNRIITDQ